MKEEKICLVITGCINPNSNVPVLAVKNCSERRKQYIDSILFYLNKTSFNRIVFCDNSDATKDTRLIKLAQKRNKQFEWISFKGNDKKVIEKGKGYGEIEIVNYVLNHSCLIKDCNCIVKVTGRLKMLNINWFIHLKKNNTNYFLKRNNSFVDTRCYCTKISDFKNFFQNAGEYVDDHHGIYLEHVFYNILTQNKIEYKLFPVEPEFVGVSGSLGYAYDSPHYKNVIKSIVAYFKNR